MAFKMAGYSAFTKKKKYKPQTQRKKEDIIPQSKDKSARNSRSYIPQSEQGKMSIDTLEGMIDATYENEYSEAKEDGDKGKMKMLAERMRGYKRQIERKGGKYKSGYKF